jgi:hypothetical protein
MQQYNNKCRYILSLKENIIILFNNITLHYIIYIQKQHLIAHPITMNISFPAHPIYTQTTKQTLSLLFFMREFVSMLIRMVHSPAEQALHLSIAESWQPSAVHSVLPLLTVYQH